MTQIIRQNGRILFQRPMVGWLIIPAAIFFIIFINAPIIFILVTIRRLGTFEIACEKQEPRVVDCEFTHKPRFSLFPVSRTRHTGITGVQRITETRTSRDRDGDESTKTDHYVIFQKLTGTQKVEFNEYEANLIVDKISGFFFSANTSLLFVQRYDIDTAFWMIIAINAIFLGIGIVSLRGIVQAIYSETVEINPYCVIHTRIGLPWYRKVIRLSSIDCLKMSEKVDDENKSYCLKLILNAGEKRQELDLYAHDSQEEILSMSKELGKLMGVRRVIPKHLRDM